MARRTCLVPPTMLFLPLSPIVAELGPQTGRRHRR
jgi:hypothetical protein